MPDGQLTEIQVSLEGLRKDVGHVAKSIEDNVIPRLNSHAKDIKSLNVSRGRAKGIGVTIAGMATAVLGIFGWYES